MLEVTQKAAEVITEFLEGKDIQAIRIMITAGCGGPSLGMALDEQKETDEVVRDSGLTFLIDKILYKEAQPIMIDFIENPMGSGFKLTSGLTASGDGCDGCSCC